MFILKVPYFVLESPKICLHASKVKTHLHFLTIHTARQSGNCLFEDSVSQNPSFIRAFSALIGQEAQSVMIGLAHVRNETQITVSEF